MSGCPLPLPTTSSTVLSLLDSLNSGTRSASASFGNTYLQIPERSSSLQTSISSFSSTPCPWKDEGSQRSLEETTTRNTATSVMFTQRETLPVYLGQTLTSHESYHWGDSAFHALELPPLSPTPLKPTPRHKHIGIKPHHRECTTAATLSSNQETEVETPQPNHRERSIAATLNSYQEILMEIAMVDVEIELVMMRAWMPRLPEKRRKAKITSRAQVECEKLECGLVQRHSRPLKEMGNFF